MIGRLLCKIGLHKGHMQPAYEIEEERGTEIDGSSAFVCQRLGCSHVNPVGPSDPEELCEKLGIPKLDEGENQ